MTVKPGFYGSKFIPESLIKVQEFLFENINCFYVKKREIQFIRWIGF
jgi:pentose-5-phosphate-3-epimerase